MVSMRTTQRRTYRKRGGNELHDEDDPLMGLDHRSACDFVYKKTESAFAECQTRPALPHEVESGLHRMLTRRGERQYKERTKRLREAWELHFPGRRFPEAVSWQ